MNKLGAKGQRNLKIFHLITVCMWLGGSFGLNIMTMFLKAPDNAGVQLGYDLARVFVDDFIIIPGAVGSLLTGLFICWLTPWGFFKQRWISVKWALTIGCIIFGTFIQAPLIYMQPEISSKLGLESFSDPLYLENYKLSIIYGWPMTAVIVFMIAISVLKPWKRKKP